VPVAATALAHVLVLDPRELVCRGVEQQLLAGAPGGLLAAPALVELRTHLGRSRDQRIADALEPLDPQQRGAPAGVARRDRQLGAERGQLQVESLDLLAEGPPRRLVVYDDRLEKGNVDDRGHPPIGAFGLNPQKTCVPSIPIRCTPTVLNTIDFAVAVPTPTGPPDAV
jgi:hypothetical protein